MKRQNHYYTLLASLPPLVRFDQAERLPINSVRLAERLRMLEPEDFEVVEHAAAFLTWVRPQGRRTDREIEAHYDRLDALATNGSIKAVIAFQSDLTTIMAALRRKHLGLPAPEPGEVWGLGPLTAPITRNWQDPDFKLLHSHPWIAQAREYLGRREALNLERLLLQTEWDFLARLSQGVEFGFDAVVVYLFKWEIVRRWLTHDSRSASARFEELTAEVMQGHGSVFS